MTYKLRLIITTLLFFFSTLTSQTTPNPPPSGYIAKKAVENLLAVCDFKDWNPSHFLDTAEMSHAVGQYRLCGSGWGYIVQVASDFQYLRKQPIRIY